MNHRIARMLAIFFLLFGLAAALSYRHSEGLSGGTARNGAALGQNTFAVIDND